MSGQCCNCQTNPAQRARLRSANRRFMCNLTRVSFQMLSHSLCQTKKIHGRTVTGHVHHVVMSSVDNIGANSATVARLSALARLGDELNLRANLANRRKTLPAKHFRARSQTVDSLPSSLAGASSSEARIPTPRTLAHATSATGLTTDHPIEATALLSPTAQPSPRDGSANSSGAVSAVVNTIAGTARRPSSSSGKWALRGWPHVIQEQPSPRRAYERTWVSGSQLNDGADGPISSTLGSRGTLLSLPTIADSEPDTSGASSSVLGQHHPHSVCHWRSVLELQSLKFDLCVDVSDVHNQPVQRGHGRSVPQCSAKQGPKARETQFHDHILRFCFRCRRPQANGSTSVRTSCVYQSGLAASRFFSQTSTATCCRC